MCLLVINCRVGGVLNVDAAPYRFQSALRPVRLPLADSCVRDPMEGYAPGWKGHRPRPKRNSNAANQRGMGRCRLHAGSDSHSAAEEIAFALRFPARRIGAG